MRRDWPEGRMLDELKNYVLQRDAVEYVLDQFGNHVMDAFASPKLSRNYTDRDFISCCGADLR